MASVGPSQPSASTGGEWKRQLEESDRQFYRNLNEIRIERGMPPVKSLFDPIGNAINDRTIFVKIWDEIYPISREILHTVFSEFGILVGIERLSRGFHSTIRFFERESTIRAFESLNGRNIYDGCCKLELFLVISMKSSSSNQECATLDEIEGASSQDTTSKGESNGDVKNPIQESEVDAIEGLGMDGEEAQIQPNASPNAPEPSTLLMATPMESSSLNQETTTLGEIEVASSVVENYNKLEAEEIANPSQEPELECSSWDFGKGESQFSVDTLKVRNDELELEQIGQRTPTSHQGNPVEVSHAISANDCSSEIEGTGGEVTNFSKVTFIPPNSGKNEVASLESVGSDETNFANHANFNGMKMASIDFRIVAIECLGISVAHKVFVEMSGPAESSFAIAAAVVKHRVQDGNSVFDPGITHFCIGLDNFMKTNVHTVCKKGRKSAMLDIGEADCRSLRNDESDGFLLKFESPRAAHESRVVSDACDVFGGLQPAAVIKGDMIVFDPGGIHWLLKISLRIMVLIFQEMEVQLILVENFVFDPGGQGAIDKSRN